jgi:signal transduction histidine kinase
VPPPAAIAHAGAVPDGDAARRRVLTADRQFSIDWQMPDSAVGIHRHRSWVVALAVAAATAVLALSAGLADLAPGGLSPLAAAADVAVGVVFVAGALIAPGGWLSRLWFVVVGWAWLVGSIAPPAYLLYLALLATALGLFPLGRPTRMRDRVVIALSAASVPVLLAGLPAPAAAWSPRPLVAVLFAGVAVTAWSARRWERAAAWYPTVAAGVVAIVLAGGWVAETSLHAAYDAAMPWMLDVAMLAIASGLPIAAWTVRRERAELADRLLADERGAGLDGLAALLAELLGDPGLRIERAPDSIAPAADDLGARPARDGSGRTAAGAGSPEGARSLPVVDGGGATIAVIRHQGPTALDDPATRASVMDAVRLVAQHEREQAAQSQQLVELEAARGRLISATDRERSAITDRLRAEVLPAIAAAAEELRAVDAGDVDRSVAEALETARAELDASAAEVLALTFGQPPAALGGGRLPAVIGDLAERCPLPVTLHSGPDAAADADAEAALFYVCSEAIANAVKHAAAHRLSIDLRRDGEALRLRVVDDGRGGADVTGSGLRGLADRLDACGGRLRVDSPAEAGTTLTAWVPAGAAS